MKTSTTFFFLLFSPSLLMSFSNNFVVNEILIFLQFLQIYKIKHVTELLNVALNLMAHVLEFLLFSFANQIEEGTSTNYMILPLLIVLLSDQWRSLGNRWHILLQTPLQTSLRLQRTRLD